MTTSVVTWSEGLSNRVSIIIRRNYRSYTAGSFITFLSIFFCLYLYCCIYIYVYIYIYIYGCMFSMLLFNFLNYLFLLLCYVFLLV